MCRWWKNPELARKTGFGLAETESLLAYASMFGMEAEASETALNFTEAAWWRRGAAILYGKAGNSVKSRTEWRLAAEMFEMSVRQRYRDRVKGGFLSKDDLVDLIDIANNILTCCTNMESFGEDGRSLLEKYSSIYSLARKALRGSQTQRPEPLLAK